MKTSLLPLAIILLGIICILQHVQINNLQKQIDQREITWQGQIEFNEAVSKQLGEGR